VAGGYNIQFALTAGIDSDGKIKPIPIPSHEKHQTTKKERFPCAP